MKQLWLRLMNEPGTARKFITALIGAVIVAVSLGLLPAAVGKWVAVASAFLSALGVYALPNDKEGTQ